MRKDRAKYLAEYQKKWRERHPFYARDWQWRARLAAALPEKWGPWPIHRNLILGIRVAPNWQMIPSVSKEQAEKEFLALYEDLAVDRQHALFL